MIILTCASDDTSKEGNHIYKNFSYKGLIQKTIIQAEKNGYTPVIFDLGLLGIGEPFFVQDKSFQEKGYYEKQLGNGYISKSLFKPEIVKICLSRYKDLVVYLDGDAQLMSNIDEIDTDDYDVGVTLRDASEIVTEWHQRYFEIVKYVNAGVIFFQNTSATKIFVENWIRLTQEVGNDQKALNTLTCPEEYPEAYSVIQLNGIRVKYFPCKKYNYYYFDEGLVPGIKIVHFKGLVRHIYPLNWKKKLLYMTLIPVKYKLLSLAKKIVLRFFKRN
jgi:hypothetical protein